MKFMRDIIPTGSHRLYKSDYLNRSWDSEQNRIAIFKQLGVRYASLQSIPNINKKNGGIKMKIMKLYGNKIHHDNTIRQSVSYEFNSLSELREFWQDNQDAGQEGDWSADLIDLKIEHVSYVKVTEMIWNEIGDTNA